MNTRGSPPQKWAGRDGARLRKTKTYNTAPILDSRFPSKPNRLVQVRYALPTSAWRWLLWITERSASHGS
jgi:hypothetical protein